LKLVLSSLILCATTKELLKLTDWLKDSECQIVAMECTASYWKPLYNILEASDLKTMVVNASHMKAVLPYDFLRSDKVSIVYKQDE